MKKRILILICCLSFCNLSLFAQKYSTAAGIRFGNGLYGLTVKQRLFRSVSAEGLLTGNEREMLGTLLLVKHYPILGRGLNAYLGGGGHMGGLQEFGPVLGVDAIAGLEMKFPFLPLIVSADIKPAYHILHEDRFDFNTAISVRYVFGKDTPKQRKKAREKRKRNKEKAKDKKEKLKEKEKKKKAKAKAKEKKEKQKEKDNKRGKEDEPKTFWERIRLKNLFNKDEDQNKR